MHTILIYSKTPLLEQVLRQQKLTYPYEYETVASLGGIEETLAARHHDLLLANIATAEEAETLSEVAAPVIMLAERSLLPSSFKPSQLHLCPKPARLAEVLAAIKHALSTKETLQLNHYCSLHMGSRSLKVKGDVIALTEKEIALLKYLHEAEGQLVGKAELLEYVWGYGKESDTHTIETHIYRLRQKIGENVIITVGDGYKIDSGE